MSVTRTQIATLPDSSGVFALEPTTDPGMSQVDQDITNNFTFLANNINTLSTAKLNVSLGNQPNGYLLLDGSGNAIGNMLIRQGLTSVMATLVLQLGQWGLDTQTGQTSLGDNAATFSNLPWMNESKMPISLATQNTQLPISKADQIFLSLTSTVATNTDLVVAIPLPDHDHQRLFLAMTKSSHQTSTGFVVYNNNSGNSLVFPDGTTIPNSPAPPSSPSAGSNSLSGLFLYMTAWQGNWYVIATSLSSADIANWSTNWNNWSGSN